MAWMRTDEFGTFTDQILDSEQTAIACLPEVFKLVLILRKLLSDTEYQVMYSPSRPYPSDLCTSETDITLYRPKSRFAPAEYKQLAYVVFDAASSLLLPDTPDHRNRWSSGSFEAVSVQTLFGSSGYGDPWSDIQLLLRTAAAAGGYTISFGRTGRDEFRIRARRYDEVLEIGTAYLIGGHYCGSVNCVIDLA